MIKKLIKEEPFNSKNETLKKIGNILFDYEKIKYEPSFIAGILSIVYHGQPIGKFESSNYGSHPEKKPDYIKLMDDKYEYRKKYSGKIITEVSMRDLKSLLKKLEKNEWTQGKFGLGCLQWKGGRTLTLFDIYKDECGNCQNITLKEARASEGRMIIKELAN